MGKIDEDQIYKNETLKVAAEIVRSVYDNLNFDRKKGKSEMARVQAELDVATRIVHWRFKPTHVIRASTGPVMVQFLNMVQGEESRVMQLANGECIVLGPNEQMEMEYIHGDQ